MVKFFRQIRFKLMETGKTSRYLKYAIGEIILVVIGILIALQVNNWNESRVKRIELNQLLLDLDEFLETQKLLFSRDIDKLKETDSILGLVNSLRDDLSDLPAIPKLDTVIFKPLEVPFTEVPKHHILLSNIDNLINRKEDFPKKYWSMIYDLEGLYMYAQEINYTSELASKTVKNFQEYLFNNSPQLFKIDSTTLNAFNRLLLKNPTSKTRLSELKQYTSNLLRSYLLYNFDSAQLSAKINYQIKEINGSDIKKLWDSYNLKQLSTKECKDEVYKDSSVMVPKRYQTILVFNNQNMAVEYQIFNEKGEILKQRKLRDKGVDVIRTTAAKVYITYSVNRKCKVLNGHSEYNYLIID